MCVFVCVFFSFFCLFSVGLFLFCFGGGGRGMCDNRLTRSTNTFDRFQQAATAGRQSCLFD